MSRLIRFIFALFSRDAYVSDSVILHHENYNNTRGWEGPSYQGRFRR